MALIDTLSTTIQIQVQGQTINNSRWRTVDEYSRRFCDLDLSTRT